MRRRSGTLGDSAAAYCPGDDTIYISQKFATDIYDGALDRALPGSSQGYGRTVGDFAVAYIVAHEYGHQIQDELGLFEQYGDQVPTMAFELQADCYAGTWAKSADRENRLEEGDVQEAIDAALAVGDFDADNPAHHGTPEQRADAWNSGFEDGRPRRRATATSRRRGRPPTGPRDTAGRWRPRPLSRARSDRADGRRGPATSPRRSASSSTPRPPARRRC